MDEFFDIPVPPRASSRHNPPRVDIELSDGTIYAVFTLDDQVIRARQAARTAPYLSCLAAVIRRDGTIPVVSAGKVFEKLRAAEDTGRAGFDLRLASDAESLASNEIPPPRDAALIIPFDEKRMGLLVFARSRGALFRYDGDGAFTCGDGFFVLPGVDILDPFLENQNLLPPAHFKAFYRALLPSLQRRRRVECPPAGDERLRRAVLESTAVTPAASASAASAHTEAVVRPAAPVASVTVPAAAIPPKPAIGIPPLPPEAQTIPPAPEPTLRVENRIVWKTQPAERREPEPPVARDFTGGALVQAVMARNRDGLQTSVGARFREDIARYAGQTAASAEYIPFTAYYPTYQAMTPRQISYYLLLRRSLRDGVKLRADMSYVLLAAYEALADEDRGGDTLEFLFFIWEQYRAQYARLDKLFPGWIRDFIVLRGLSFPISGIRERVPFENTEQAVGHPDVFAPGGSVGDTLESMSVAELCAAAEYKLSESRAASTAEGVAAFSGLLRRAVDAAVAASEPCGGIDALFPSEPRSFTVRSYVGAVRTPEDSYDITYTYVPRSRNAALTVFLDALCRAAENAARRELGIRGRLRDGRLDERLRSAVERALSLPSSAAPEPQPPESPAPLELDIARAAEIERESWSTTDKLIAIVGESDVRDDVPDNFADASPDAEGDLSDSADVSVADISVRDGSGGDTEPDAALPAAPQHADEWDAFLARLDALELQYLASALGLGDRPDLGLRLEDDVIGEINAAASEETGDIVIEDGAIIEDYRDELVKHINPEV